MWYIILIVFLLFGAIFGTRLACRNIKSGQESKQINGQSDAQTNELKNTNDTIKAMFSKKQIEKKLKRLADTPPPANLSYGAKCYSIAIFNTEVFEYVCPVCGEKTIYRKKSGKDNFPQIKRVLEYDLDKCRRLIEKVKGINISLDETQFCSKCKPNAENPSLCLLVNIAGQNDTTKVCNIKSEDIIIIREFLEDSLVHTGVREEEYPLAHYSKRIKELLGI